MEITEIAKAFSLGQFDQIKSNFSSEIEWLIVGENHFKGKKAVVENCDKTNAYFQSVVTKFSIDHVLEDGNKVVILGVGEFYRNREKLVVISASDFYEFNDRRELTRIMSYCIPEKR